jgi:hypothetical protein
MRPLRIAVLLAACWPAQALHAMHHCQIATLENHALESLMASISQPLDGNKQSDNSNWMNIPSQQDRTEFANLVVAALNGDDHAGCTLSEKFPTYRLVHLPGGVRFIGEIDAKGAPIAHPPTAHPKYWGAYASNTAYKRNLMVEAPHPVFDQHTDAEGAKIFSGVHARYLIVGGGHRCMNTGASTCVGKTGVCDRGTLKEFRESDAGHSVTIPFYWIHLALFEHDPHILVVQLHSNVNGQCPTALVSDSTTEAAEGLAKTLNEKLAHHLSGGTTSLCNTSGYTSTYAEKCKLCGTNNVQARQVAGAANACTGAQGPQLANLHTRWVHIEQKQALVDTPAPLIQAVAEAVAEK